MHVMSSIRVSLNSQARRAVSHSRRQADEGSPCRGVSRSAANGGTSAWINQRADAGFWCLLASVKACECVLLGALLIWQGGHQLCGLRSP